MQRSLYSDFRQRAKIFQLILKLHGTQNVKDNTKNAILFCTSQFFNENNKVNSIVIFYYVQRMKIILIKLLYFSRLEILHYKCVKLCIIVNSKL